MKSFECTTLHNELTAILLKCLLCESDLLNAWDKGTDLSMNER